MVIYIFALIPALSRNQHHVLLVSVLTDEGADRKKKCRDPSFVALYVPALGTRSALEDTTRSIPNGTDGPGAAAAAATRGAPSVCCMLIFAFKYAENIVT